MSYKLIPSDIEKRLMMCRWFENEIDEDPDFMDDVWFSDEAHFWLCGHLNSNNCVYWCEETQDEAQQDTGCRSTIWNILV